METRRRIAREARPARLDEPAGAAEPARFRRPPRLLPGDRVAVVAPAGPTDRESLEAGLRILGSRYAVEWEPGLLSRTRYLAGDDARRGAELGRALGDPGIAAVVAARGGYGCLRLLPALWPVDAAGRPAPPAAPKLLVGFSDLTALHAAQQATGVVSVHGPVVTQLGGQPRPVVERLFALLEDARAAPPPLLGTPVVGGIAEGPLLGGNLSVLTRLLGTPWLPDLAGAILLVEDVGERPYRVDRMWTHLRLAGVFARIAGLALGEFTDCEERDGDYVLQDLLGELAAATGLPCVAGLPVGHGAVNVPLPLGCRVRIDGGTGALVVLEPAVAARPPR
ncbi:MAG TPA: LD-carboxypeptidase [Methylomirabilota bacterium]|jgi:muramoyltetrapeptide carboxypeptidase|nr:LD-carboxypeptidase [Methylomirabilota bacterium]